MNNYEPDVESYSGYYPFHSIMPGRSSNSNEYRYGGAGGQEKDDEITGVVGSHYTAEYWEYDSRLGRRWNVDPVDKPWMSSYHTFSNKPITNNDPDGACDDCPKDAKVGDVSSPTGVGYTFTAGEAGNEWVKSGGTLAEFTMVGGGGSDGSWSSEVGGNPTFAYGGSFGQWKSEYGFGGSRDDIMSHWEGAHGDDFSSYVSSEIQKEKGRIAVEKMKMFMGGFINISTVVGPVTAINSFNGAASPKQFNYTPRSTNYYPANDGFVNGKYMNELLQSGTMLDRYGSDFGRYLSPQGTPFNMRALPNSAAKSQLSIFRVTKSFSVQSGKAAPAFGKYGLGTQYKTSSNVKTLLEGGFLERVK